MKKSDARAQQIAALKAYPQPQRDRETTDLVKQLIGLEAWHHARTIATTVSGPFEVATGGIIAAAQAAGKQVLLPKVMPERQMAFMPYNGMTSLVRSNFGLLEPAYDEQTVNNAPDLVIVPGLAYAMDTHVRLGFGGGYYDRFLAKFHGVSISLALPIQQVQTAFWPVEGFDMPLQQILTIN
ncbi:5-formyltetrahydrofolate cyclo-ligase [Lacticaseibacillus pabuli]|uniref:5-formyltetrahydrofolate cyclo-ligase n=1 Tax=Lacticaseibacillus pabuli TaxID=3025672 RepID=A0ABY7WUH0_9LACO|nr:5-formyltetrahydrofolate cyclo-ligase [Lacticaseibacillus sp. KACC 23028]WDF83803.1 5-formyltetrahydrofolate cyclo-ligase [Lacticaseibacillus sp. KACC 23028]